MMSALHCPPKLELHITVSNAKRDIAWLCHTYLKYR